MNTRNIAIVVGLTGLLFTTSIYALTLSAQEFVTKASIGNQFEIASSKIALQKSQNDSIKSFARQMVDDHGKTGDKLKDVLASSPSHASPADELDDKHKKLLDKLESESGNDFDHDYVSIQTDAHKETISLFEDYSKSGQDMPLKNFAADTLPKLKEHFGHVQKLNAN